jgi:hypothetical protein
MQEQYSYWLKQLKEAIFSLNHDRLYCTSGYFSSSILNNRRRWVKHCLYNYYYYGGIGGNPLNVKKYFPKRDNSWVE